MSTPPPNKKVSLRQQIAGVLRAEANGVELQEGRFGIHVIAVLEDGSEYELGHVSENAILQDPEGATAMINRIKFCRRQETDAANRRDEGEAMTLLERFDADPCWQAAPARRAIGVKFGR